MKHLNRVKMINSFYGETAFSCRGGLADFASLDKINKFVEDVIPIDGSMPRLYSKFLLEQDYEIARFLSYKIKKKEKELNKSIVNNQIYLYRKIENIKEAEIYCSALMSGYDSYIYEILNFLKMNPSNFRNLNLLLKKASLIKDAYDKYNRYMNLNTLFDMSYNDSFRHMDEISIVEFAKRSKRFNVDYKVISREEINIVFDEDYKYIPYLNKSSLEVLSIIRPHLNSYELESLYTGVGLFDDYSSTEYLINTLVENDSINLLPLIIKACSKGYIQDGKDITLIANKIKYGEKFNKIIDFAYLLSGIKDIKLKESEFSKIISFKKVLSKNFYRFLLSKEELLLKTAKRLDADILGKISYVLELGQLNEKEYCDLLDKVTLINSSDLKRVWDFDFGYKLSYQEFSELVDVHDECIMDYVASLKNIKSSLRILKIKEIKELHLSLCSKKFIFGFKDAFDVLGDKSIKHEMKINNPLEFDDMSEYLNYMILNERYGIDKIEDYRKYVLVDTFVGIKNIGDKDIDEVVMSCSAVEDIMNLLNLSEEFKKQYSNEIFNFLISEEFELVYGYFKNRNVDKIQLNSLALIAKSLIAGKYDELKFVKEDIEKEAGTNISDDEFENWKRTDEVSYKNYTIRDESDFKYIMRMGEIPVRSCMHYGSGGYSKCLLSNFDTTKKILTIHKNGKYVGRAIIRLTKMSNEDYTNEVDGLAFIDVDKSYLEEVALDKAETKVKDENLILFLEKQYTTLDKSDLVDLFDTLVDFLKNKAESLGAKLVVSRSYEEIASVINRKYEFEDKYVFITASKNGYQYLDSFDGSTTKAYCYKKGKVIIY